MKHTPVTEEQIAAAGLLPEGVYDFTIASAEEKVSSGGNDMFALRLTVFDTQGEDRIIFDWVLPSFPKKYKHLHDALGLLDLYQSGETKSDNLVGKSGKLILGIGKPYTDNNGLERVNNSVVDYVKRDNVATYKSAVMPKAVLDDEIPFG